MNLGLRQAVPIASKPWLLWTWVYFRAKLVPLFSRLSAESILQAEVCNEALGKFSLGKEYFAPLYSTVPSLFLSGTLDADTPPMKAERMRWGFLRSTHIIVENGFHETLPATEVQALVVEFLQGANVADRHVTFAAPSFLSLDDVKRGQRPTQ